MSGALGALGALERLDGLEKIANKQPAAAVMHLPVANGANQLCVGADGKPHCQCTANREWKVCVWGRWGLGEMQPGKIAALWAQGKGMTASEHLHAHLLVGNLLCHVNERPELIARPPVPKHNRAVVRAAVSGGAQSAMA